MKDPKKFQHSLHLTVLNAFLFAVLSVGPLLVWLSHNDKALYTKEQSCMKP